MHILYMQLLHHLYRDLSVVYFDMEQMPMDTQALLHIYYKGKIFVLERVRQMNGSQSSQKRNRPAEFRVNMYIKTQGVIFPKKKKAHGSDWHSKHEPIGIHLIFKT